MSRKNQDDSFRFVGFDNPTTTPVPDVVFDRFLAVLGEAELKALLYIIRRTFGFKRDRNPISFNQFLNGITTHDGRSLDEGCGIRSRTTLSAALKSLEEKGIIQSEKSVDDQGENVTTVYSLRFKEGAERLTEARSASAGNDHPTVVEEEGSNEVAKKTEKTEGVVRNSYYRSTEFGKARGGTKFVLGGTEFVPGVVRNSYPQQTVLRQTDVVVVDTLALLHFYGVEKQKAEAIAQNYSPEYVREKTELLEQKLRKPGQGQRIKDPAAWLIRAIEENYQPPDTTRRRARWRQETLDLPTPDGSTTPESPASRRQQALDTLYRQHETTAAEMDTWAQVLAEIRRATTAATFETWFLETRLLSLRDGQALIAVSNQATKEWLLGRLSPILQRAFQNVLGGSVAPEIIVYDG